MVIEMSDENIFVTCPACGRKTVRKKRCMHCWARLPVEEQGKLGGGGIPYWHRGMEQE
ncbi:MAG: hypothetical protein NZ570_01205 [Candidatus Caldarchaeum sp.]|nr:hypothetical protein [Candidatus Caldarchaeum sp.]MDW7978073.1 hypothetical protein [Candidatus Caldarchaeum sp.]MDW8360090.1 hypothetical protein [Candidatus Caldarchaeum sp.]